VIGPGIRRWIPREASRRRIEWFVLIFDSKCHQQRAEVFKFFTAGPDSDSTAGRWPIAAPMVSVFFDELACKEHSRDMFRTLLKHNNNIDGPGLQQPRLHK
jgi:hypothetical protein